MNVLTSVVALRYPPWKLPNQEGALARLPASRLFSLMWLPVGFSAAEAAMAGDLPWLMDLDGWLYLAALAPVAVVVSVYAAPHGALLAATCAAAASLPVWLLYGLGYRAGHARRERRRKTRRIAR